MGFRHEARLFFWGERKKLAEERRLIVKIDCAVSPAPATAAPRPSGSSFGAFPTVAVEPTLTTLLLGSCCIRSYHTSASTVRSSLLTLEGAQLPGPGPRSRGSALASTFQADPCPHLSLRTIMLTCFSLSDRLVQLPVRVAFHRRSAPCRSSPSEPSADSDLLQSRVSQELTRPRPRVSYDLLGCLSFDLCSTRPHSAGQSATAPT